MRCHALDGVLRARATAAGVTPPIRLRAVPKQQHARLVSFSVGLIGAPASLTQARGPKAGSEIHQRYAYTPLYAGPPTAPRPAASPRCVYTARAISGTRSIASSIPNSPIFNKYGSTACATATLALRPMSAVRLGTQ